jgi:integrase
MPPESLFPRLRRKGKAFYYDTQSKPVRHWIALGSDPVVAVERYKRLESAKGRAGTVDRMIAEYLEHLAGGGKGALGEPIAKSSLRAYRIWHVHLSGVFGSMDPATITQADVARYLADCRRTTARNEIAVLSGAYHHAMLHSRLTFNPCAGVKSNVKRRRRERYLEDGELAAVRVQAAPIVQVAIDLAYLTSLRVSDLIRLRWDDFTAESVIQHRKTGSRQRFVLTDDLRDVLAAAKALQGRVASLYVLSHRGAPLKQRTLGNWWTKACRAAGVEDAHWHDIRAKAGTDADEAGQNAQRLLGHADARTTAGYLRSKRVIEVEPVRRRK